MIITICGSIKFYDEMIKVKGVDYWEKDNAKRVEAKKKFEFIS